MKLPIYQSLVSQHLKKHDVLHKQLNVFAFARLLSFLAAVVFLILYIKTGESYWLAGCVVSAALFFITVRLYQLKRMRLDFVNVLLRINKTEIAMLEGAPSPYPNGSENVDPHHPFSFDLDLFGEGSLYTFLNRTTTPFGSVTLASMLLQPDNGSIKERQEAIKELADRLNFRQAVQAAGSLHEVEGEDLAKLRRWLTLPRVFSRKVYYYLLLLFPLATITSLVMYLVTSEKILLNLCSALFILNFLITAAFLKKIMSQVTASTTVGKVLDQFSQQLAAIEGQDFNAILLKRLKASLGIQDNASNSIKRLASLFKYLDFIINPVMSALLNGLTLFHVHVLFALDIWKKKNDNRVEGWLETIGIMESLNSFAGFAFNNPDYCFADVSTEETVYAVKMEHPLIPRNRNVSNDISFTKERFVVLTGSNMSGKSTFLRTLGVNMVLAKAGSCVAAEKFVLFPFNLFVSMRISDSLQDSESLFYAELSRLQKIISQVETEGRTLVILDEILRGTNSNDKHAGTIGLIRKLVLHRSFGIIATHDLTVAELSKEFPGDMSNKCFESELINGELVFDYKLKDGVCTKLNASFLMKKMGIID